MTTTNKTSKLYESPVKKNNDTERESKCVCCGKVIKNYDAPGSLWVHMNTDWEAVNKTIDEENCLEETGHESQGSFPIGRECAKHMHEDFIIVQI